MANTGNDLDRLPFEDYLPPVHGQAIDDTNTIGVPIRTTSGLRLLILDLPPDEGADLVSAEELSEKDFFEGNYDPSDFPGWRCLTGHEFDLPSVQ